MIGLRDYEDGKADVILKYNADEVRRRGSCLWDAIPLPVLTQRALQARNLKTYGELPDSVRINETVTFGEENLDDDVMFDDVDEADIDDVRRFSFLFNLPFERASCACLPASCNGFLSIIYGVYVFVCMSD